MEVHVRHSRRWTQLFAYPIQFLTCDIEPLAQGFCNLLVVKELTLKVGDLCASVVDRCREPFAFIAYGAFPVSNRFGQLLDGAQRGLALGFEGQSALGAHDGLFAFGQIAAQQIGTRYQALFVQQPLPPFLC